MVQPSPSKALKADIMAAYAAKPISLEALFDGANPFEGADGTSSDLVFRQTALD
jgi:hypothetical protein